MAEPIHYIEHAAEVLAVAARLICEKRRFVLVTAIEIKGGSSRECGTLALIDDQGAMFGYMSNGCIDRDIQEHGKSALAAGEARVLHYGAGSPFLDLTLPCGGTLKLLLDPKPDNTEIRKAHAALSKRNPATLSFLEPDTSRQHIFRYLPVPRMVLAGRGSVFRAMAKTARMAGFDLVLMSPEEEDLNALSRLSDFPSIHLQTPGAVPEIELDEHSAFLTLFHDHDWEPALIIKALDTRARFIGCLGSKRTHEKRCATLAGMGADEREIARVSGPIGLVPSLRQAPLISVSALAEVIEAFPAFIEQLQLSDA